MTDKQAASDEWIASLRARFPTEKLIDTVLTRKLHRRRTASGKKRALEPVESRLRAFFVDQLAGECDVTNITALTGGSSKEQYRFQLHLRDESGTPSTRDYVLRLEPEASIVETSRAREAAILRALHGSLAVPDAPWCDPEGSAFGQPALIMDFVTGLVKPPAEGLGEVTGPKQAFGKHYRQLVGPHFLQMIADIHRFDWRQSDMAAFDIPRAGTNEAVLWQVNWWRRVWEEDSVEPMPLMTMVGHWLAENTPSVDHVSVIHGDLRGGNFLFDQDTGEIRAMLDWELVHLGDRHEDLAYIMQDVFAVFDEDGNYLVNGFWPVEAFLSDYERLSGLPVDRKRLDYYRVFHGYRAAVVMLATALRVASEAKTHQDILVAWISGTGVTCLQDLVDSLVRD